MLVDSVPGQYLGTVGLGQGRAVSPTVCWRGWSRCQEKAGKLFEKVKGGRGGGGKSRHLSQDCR